MRVTDFIEQEDGSAIVTFETTPEENQFLIGYAILDILKKRIERENQDENNISPTISQ